MITHKGTQTLRTPRLTLRPFTVDDAPAMYENWAHDERVTRYLTWQPHASADSTRELLTLWCAQYEKPDYYSWAIEYEGTLVGSISVVECDDNSRRSELGYCMGHAYWGKGLMTEAVGAVLDFLFAQVGLNRVSIAHAVANPTSGRVAQKCGLRYEGTLRKYYRASTGELTDVCEYSILRREWEARQRPSGEA